MHCGIEKGWTNRCIVGCILSLFNPTMHQIWYFATWNKPYTRNRPQNLNIFSRLEAKLLWGRGGVFPETVMGFLWQVTILYKFKVYPYTKQNETEDMHSGKMRISTHKTNIETWTVAPLHLLQGGLWICNAWITNQHPMRSSKYACGTFKLWMIH